MLRKREADLLWHFAKLAVGYLVVLVILSWILILIEPQNRWSFLDAFYQIVITVSTVGFGEVKPLTPLGRLYIIGVIFLQTGFFVYLTSKLVELAISGELREILNYRRLQKMLKNVENHVIVVGLGRVGSSLVENLDQLGEQVVGIDKNTELVKSFTKKYPYIPFIDCDAQEEECLKRAKTEVAKALILTIPSDAENLFIVVTARNLNPHLKIISRFSNPKNVKKLKQAGADEVFSPEVESGKLLAMLLEKPNVSKLLNTLLLDENNPFDIEEFLVKPCSAVANRAVGEAFKGQAAGILIAIKRGETFLIFPAKEEVIRPGDVLIVMGDVEQLSTLSVLIDC